MSLLEKLQPVKKEITHSITVYEEDVELFLNAVEYMNNKFKGGGKFTEAQLFEHVCNVLREDVGVKEYNLKRSKRKFRGTRGKGKAEKQSEVVQ
jgi:hypothetical protein